MTTLPTPKYVSGVSAARGVRSGVVVLLGWGSLTPGLASLSNCLTNVSVTL
ncbi:Uncharacterised protein [Mycobacterium tuberculosis]|nr:Uncharacterised protein [Mycobacterium tuberculosis]COY53663.1 Uncharacterised protein [Mycobacterium tuberculosis]